MLSITSPARLAHYGHPVPPLALDDVAAANHYDAMPHSPWNFMVRDAYAAFREGTLAQWADLLATGLAIRFHDGEHDYPDSATMHADIARGHLFTRRSEHDGLPADHPMTEMVGLGTAVDGLTIGVSLNDVFRAVHDVNGHYGDATARHFSFGPNGERSAWLRHRQAYDSRALPALWCETRGQSAWVNDYADHRSLPLASRPFAAQKSGYVSSALA